MFGHSRWRLGGASCVVLLLAAFALPGLADAQDFVTVMQARARVLPELGTGVTAMKRDGAGRYYVLAAPANVILVFSPEGKRIGQIPAAGSGTGPIQYAVDFDLDASGRVLVADRAANAVEIFSANGALLAKVPVIAPTGVVALPDNQFAVSTLRSKRLIEIRDEHGAVVRSFGDPSEEGIEADSKKLQNAGKVSGDGLGDIYFAFAALPDPTVRKYNRYGYAASDFTFATSRYEPKLATTPDDRVQFGLNFSEVNFSNSFNTWTAIGNKGDILFGGGLSPGLASHTGGPATAQSASDSILSTGLATGPGGGGAGGMAGGGMVSAQGSYQGGDSLKLHFGGRARGRSAGSSAGSGGSADGSILQFNAQDSNSNTDELFGDLNLEDGSQGLFAFNQPSDAAPVLGSAVPGGGALSVGMRGAGGPGGGMFGGAGLLPGLGGFGRVGGTNFAGGIGGGVPFGDAPQSADAGLSPTKASNLPAPPTASVAATTPLVNSATSGSNSLGAGSGAASGPGSSGRPLDGHPGGVHDRYGHDLYNLTGTVKVNLDHFPAASDDKPIISAVGIDPVSQDMWVAIGRVLAHFDKNGAYVADYYIGTPEGTAFHASAIVVEPDRLIVASDSRGVFEFTRPDVRAPRSSVQGAAIRQPTQKDSTSQQ